MKKPTRYLLEWFVLSTAVGLVVLAPAPELVRYAGVGFWVAFWVVWFGRLLAMPPRRLKRAVAGRVTGNGRLHRPPIPQMTRDRVMENRVGARKVCRTCLRRPSEHLGHVWARAWGAPDALWNYWPQCAACNLSAGADMTRRDMAVVLVPGPRDWLVYALWPVAVVALVVVQKVGL